MTQHRFPTAIKVSLEQLIEYFLPSVLNSSPFISFQRPQERGMLKLKVSNFNYINSITQLIFAFTRMHLIKLRLVKTLKHLFQIIFKYKNSKQ